MAKFERSVIFRQSNGVIGPGHHATEVVLYRCLDCGSAVLPPDVDTHQRWHEGNAHIDGCQEAENG